MTVLKYAAGVNEEGKNGDRSTAILFFSLAKFFDGALFI